MEIKLNQHYGSFSLNEMADVLVTASSDVIARRQGGESIDPANLTKIAEAINELDHVFGRQSLNAEEKNHVDYFVSYGGEKFMDKDDDYARFVLMYFRLPAGMKMAFAPMMKDFKLFATYQGRRYRVTGASRMGDVWLAERMDREDGYDLRVHLKDLSNWSNRPVLESGE